MKKKRPTRFRKGKPVRPPKSAEVRYRKKLLRLIASINDLIKAQVLPVIRANAGNTLVSDSAQVRDGYVGEVAATFAGIQTMLDMSIGDANKTGAEFVGSVSATAATRTAVSQEAAGFTVGTMKSLVEAEKMQNALDAMTAENVDLIKDLGNDYLRKIQRAVTDNYLSGKYTGDGGLEKELSKISGITKNRAKLIARDQTNKINGTFHQLRAENSGSIGYQWSTVHDQRVRGNPAGKYPNVKHSHYDRDRKYFLWKPMANPPLAPDGKPFRQPPEDGPPGKAFNCRCYSASVWIEGDDELVTSR